jgi:hypothetical protein
MIIIFYRCAFVGQLHKFKTVQVLCNACDQSASDGLQCHKANLSNGGYLHTIPTTKFIKNMFTPLSTIWLSLCWYSKHQFLWAPSIMDVIQIRRKCSIYRQYFTDALKYRIPVTATIFTKLKTSKWHCVEILPNFIPIGHKCRQQRHNFVYALK